MPLDSLPAEPAAGRAPRVALFSGNYNYTLDGANRTLNRLVAHLEAVEGMPVRIYSPTSSTPAFPPTGELVSVPSVPIPGRPDYRVSLGLPTAVRRDIEAFAPDIFHLSAPDPLGIQAQKLARSLGVPVVASLHTLFERYLDYYALGWARPLIERRLQRFYGDCDYVLAPTRAVADSLEVAGLRGRTRVWSRGVDSVLFHPDRRDQAWRRAQGFQDDTPVIVFFGRLVMEKGLAVFADAVRRLQQTQPSARALVVGDGPARNWLQQALPDATFTGLLQGTDLARAVASSDILVNPSPTESFGNVYLEAMASGLAVVCADAVNCRSILAGAALYCDATDAAAFAAAATRLVEDPQGRARMAEAARLRSLQYQWPEILASVARTYREALSARHVEICFGELAYALTA